MSKSQYLLYFVCAFTVLSATVGFMLDQTGDWKLVGKFVGFHFIMAVLALGLIFGLIALIRWTSLRRLNTYVQRLYEAGYDAPGIQDHEARWFSICLFCAVIMVPASIWLWYELYFNPSVVVGVFAAFPTILGICGTWQAVKTWKSVSKRLKGYCTNLKNGNSVMLPRLRG